MKKKAGASGGRSESGSKASLPVSCASAEPLHPQQKEKTTASEDKPDEANSSASLSTAQPLHSLSLFDRLRLSGAAASGSEKPKKQLTLDDIFGRPSRGEAESTESAK